MSYMTKKLLVKLNKTHVTEVEGVYTYTISYEGEVPKEYETYNKIFNGSDIVITKKNYKPKNSYQNSCVK